MHKSRNDQLIDNYYKNRLVMKYFLSKNVKFVVFSFLNTFLFMIVNEEFGDF